MPEQIVPTHADGDQRFAFKVDNDAEVKVAMERFNDLVKNQKRTAVALGKDGAPGRLIRSFDPTVEKTIFMPQRQGG